ncbi:MAG: N-acetylmuramoyl-L-alanine amidase-like domain-containing protein [Bacteriovoracia bacterium]
MLKFFILLILSTGSLFATPREEAQEILTRFAVETDVTKRLDKISNIFVGLPYGKNGPLGEGPTGKYDQDPLYRFDTFDCTTYVETIMALALSRDVNEFESHLNLIRYKDGEINYLTRNHFTDLQWIPFNVEAGYLQEINHEVVGPLDIKVAEAVINFGGWLLSHKVEQIKVPLASSHEKEKLLAELHAEAAFYSPVIARVSYIEISLLVAQPGLLNKIPSGSLVNFVRPNWDLTEVAGTHQNISHQGFLFRKGKVLYLRHASTSGKVEELPFIDYLKRFLNHSTLKGVHLMKMNQAL